MRTYQKKFNPDGTPNPRFVPRKQPGDRHSPEYKQAHRGDRHSVEYKQTHTGDRHSPAYRQTRPNAFQGGFFVAWDGEGVTPGNVIGEYVNKETKEVHPIYAHNYNYIASSQGHELLNTKRTLRTVECFELLLQGAADCPSATHVVFSGSYDVNMILVDVPRELLQVLYEGDTVEWGDYLIAYVPRKEFSLKKLGTPHKKLVTTKKRDGTIKKSYKDNVIGKVRLWDVFGFFQGSFVSALKSYGFPQADIDYITGMKLSRGTFTTKQFKKEVVPYCQKELVYLKQLMNKLKDYLIEAGIEITRWDGAGAIAAAILKKQGISKQRGDIPARVNDVSRYAFSGGRIECLKYGHYNGTVYHYDICSAYPDKQMRLCQSFTNGEWHGLDISGDHLELVLKYFPSTVCRIRYNFPPGMLLYPFSHRDIFEQISYPQTGENWVWSPEVLAAIKCIPNAQKYMEIKETWSYIDHNPTYPFGFIQELYDTRARWKQEGKGAEKVLKLGVNSFYGKTIQKQGYREDGGDRTQIPPYFQLQWAGLITSATRAALYTAAMQAPDKIICLATDGIFSSVPLDLPTGNTLGSWEENIHTDMTIVQSGVYWYTNPDGSIKEYYRGFDKGTITRDKVLNAWGENKHVLPTKSTRFITLGSALVSDDRFMLWRTWHSIDRNLALDSTQSAKRVDRIELTQTGEDYLWGNDNPAKGLRQTYPRTSVTEMSQPYKLPWEQKYIATIDGVPESIVLAEEEDSYS